MQQEQARDGDVLLDPEGKVWLRSGDNIWNWTTFSGPVAYYGDWKREYGPVGELTLLVREGKAVQVTAAPPPVDAGTVAQAEGQ